MGKRARKPLTSEGARKLGERERAIGLDSGDDAARWLEDHEPKPPPATPKSAGKSKLLHRWRLQEETRKRG
jgi:hypothetical protein